MPGRPPLLSVVAPVFNEDDSLEAFCKRTAAALDDIQPPVDAEFVFVDDGSTDRSREILSKLAVDDDRVRVIHLSRNFGHQVAITAGIDHASGDAVVIIDADLQDPPEVIAQMVEQWRAGFKVVFGQRTQRHGESGFKLLTARAFYRLLNRLSDVPLPVDSGDFRLLDRDVVDVLKTFRESNRYLRGLVSWVGFRQTAVEYERDARYAGDTKFTVRKMMRFALDGITSFSEKPLRLATQVGLVVMSLSLLFTGSVVVRKVLSPEFALPGWASLMAAVAFLGAVQLLSIGVLGEYVGRIYRESKGRPLYVVEVDSGGRQTGDRDDEREDPEKAGADRPGGGDSQR